MAPPRVAAAHASHPLQPSGMLPSTSTGRASSRAPASAEPEPAISPEAALQRACANALAQGTPAAWKAVLVALHNVPQTLPPDAPLRPALTHYAARIRAVFARLQPPPLPPPQLEAALDRVLGSAATAADGLPPVSASLLQRTEEQRGAGRGGAGRGKARSAPVWPSGRGGRAHAVAPMATLGRSRGRTTTLPAGLFESRELLAALPPLPPVGDASSSRGRGGGVRRLREGPTVPAIAAAAAATSVAPLLRTGVDAVTYMARLRAGGDKLDFVYLNYVHVAPRRRPYDLVVVDQAALDPRAHVIMSTSGVTLVEAGGTTEHLALEDWLRQRSQYEHVSRLRFFRTFLTRRTFSAWRRFGVYSAIAARGKHLATHSLAGNPAFQAALLQARAQVLQLDRLPLLGIDPLKTYSLDMWRETSAEALAAALPQLAAVLRQLQRIARRLEERFRENTETARELLLQPPPALVLSKLTAFRQGQEAHIAAAQHNLELVPRFYRLALRMYLQHCITLVTASFRYELAAAMGWRASAPPRLSLRRRSTLEASAFISRFSSRRTSTTSSVGDDAMTDTGQSEALTFAEAGDVEGQGEGGVDTRGEGSAGAAELDSATAAATGARVGRGRAWVKARTLDTLNELTEADECVEDADDGDATTLATADAKNGASADTREQPHTSSHTATVNDEAGNADKPEDDNSNDDNGNDNNGNDLDDVGDVWEHVRARPLHYIPETLLRESAPVQATTSHGFGLLCVEFTLDPVSARSAAEPVYEHLQAAVYDCMDTVLRALSALLLCDPASLQADTTLATVEDHLSRRLVDADRAAAGAAADTDTESNPTPATATTTVLSPAMWGVSDTKDVHSAANTTFAETFHYLAPPAHRGLALHLETFVRATDAYEETRALVGDRLLAAYADVVGMVMQYEWVEEVALFARDWSGEALQTWRGRCHLLFDLQSQLQSWAARLRDVPVTRMSRNGVLRLESRALKRDVLPRLLAISRDLDSTLNTRIQEDVNEVLDLALQQITSLRKEANMTHPTSTEYSKVVAGAARARNVLPELRQKMEQAQELMGVKRRIHATLHLGADTLPALATMEAELRSRWSELNSMLAAAEQLIKVLAPTMISRLRQTLLEQEEEAAGLQALLDSGMYTHPFSRAARVLTKLFQVGFRLQQLKGRSGELRAALTLIDKDTTPAGELDKAQAQLDVRKEIWTQAKEIGSCLKEWMALPFAEVHLKLINTSASDWTSALADLRMRFPRDDIVSTLQTRVHAFLDLSRALLPVTDPAVDAEHWRVLFAALGHEFDDKKHFSLRNLKVYGVEQHQELIALLRSIAQRQLKARQWLKRFAQLWAHPDSRWRLAFRPLVMHSLRDMQLHTPSSATNSAHRPRPPEQPPAGRLAPHTGRELRSRYGSLSTTVSTRRPHTLEQQDAPNPSLSAMQNSTTSNSHSQSSSGLERSDAAAAAAPGNAQPSWHTLGSASGASASTTARGRNTSSRTLTRRMSLTSTLLHATANPDHVHVLDEKECAQLRARLCALLQQAHAYAAVTAVHLAPALHTRLTAMARDIDVTIGALDALLYVQPLWLFLAGLWQRDHTWRTQLPAAQTAALLEADDLFRGLLQQLCYFPQCAAMLELPEGITAKQHLFGEHLRARLDALQTLLAPVAAAAWPHVACELASVVPQVLLLSETQGIQCMSEHNRADSPHITQPWLQCAFQHVTGLIFSDPATSNMTDLEMVQCSIAGLQGEDGVSWPFTEPLHVRKDAAPGAWAYEALQAEGKTLVCHYAGSLLAMGLEIVPPESSLRDLLDPYSQRTRGPVDLVCVANGANPVGCQQALTLGAAAAAAAAPSAPSGMRTSSNAAASDVRGEAEEDATASACAAAGGPLAVLLRWAAQSLCASPSAAVGSSGQLLTTHREHLLGVPSGSRDTVDVEGASQEHPLLAWVAGHPTQALWVSLELLLAEALDHVLAPVADAILLASTPDGDVTLSATPSRMPSAAPSETLHAKLCAGLDGLSRQLHTLRKAMLRLPATASVTPALEHLLPPQAVVGERVALLQATLHGWALFLGELAAKSASSANGPAAALALWRARAKLALISPIELPGGFETTAGGTLKSGHGSRGAPTSRSRERPAAAGLLDASAAAATARMHASAATTAARGGGVGSGLGDDGGIRVDVEEATDGLAEGEDAGAASVAALTAHVLGVRVRDHVLPLRFRWQGHAPGDGGPGLALPSCPATAALVSALADGSWATHANEQDERELVLRLAWQLGMQVVALDCRLDAQRLAAALDGAIRSGAFLILNHVAQASASSASVLSVIAVKAQAARHWHRQRWQLALSRAQRARVTVRHAPPSTDTSEDAAVAAAAAAAQHEDESGSASISARATTAGQRRKQQAISFRPFWQGLQAAAGEALSAPAFFANAAFVLPVDDEALPAYLAAIATRAIHPVAAAASSREVAQALVNEAAGTAPSKPTGMTFPGAPSTGGTPGTASATGTAAPTAPTATSAGHVQSPRRRSTEHVSSTRSLWGDSQAPGLTLQLQSEALHAAIRLCLHIAATLHLTPANTHATTQAAADTAWGDAAWLDSTAHIIGDLVAELSPAIAPHVGLAALVRRMTVAAVHAAVSSSPPLTTWGWAVNGRITAALSADVHHAAEQVTDAIQSSVEDFLLPLLPLPRQAEAMQRLASYPPLLPPPGPATAATPPATALHVVASATEPDFALSDDYTGQSHGGGGRSTPFGARLSLTYSHRSSLADVLERRWSRSSLALLDSDDLPLGTPLDRDRERQRRSTGFTDMSSQSPPRRGSVTGVVLSPIEGSVASEGHSHSHSRLVSRTSSASVSASALVSAPGFSPGQLGEGVAAYYSLAGLVCTSAILDCATALQEALDRHAVVLFIGPPVGGKRTLLHALVHAHALGAEGSPTAASPLSHATATAETRTAASMDKESSRIPTSRRYASTLATDAVTPSGGREAHFAGTLLSGMRRVRQQHPARSPVNHAVGSTASTPRGGGAGGMESPRPGGGGPSRRERPAARPRVSPVLVELVELSSAVLDAATLQAAVIAAWEARAQQWTTDVSHTGDVAADTASGSGAATSGDNNDSEGGRSPLAGGGGSGTGARWGVTPIPPSPSPLPSFSPLPGATGAALDDGAAGAKRARGGVGLRRLVDGESDPRRQLWFVARWSTAAAMARDLPQLAEALRQRAVSSGVPLRYMPRLIAVISREEEGEDEGECPAVLPARVLAVAVPVYLPHALAEVPQIVETWRRRATVELPRLRPLLRNALTEALQGLAVSLHEVLVDIVHDTLRSAERQQVSRGSTPIPGSSSMNATGTSNYNGNVTGTSAILDGEGSSSRSPSRAHFVGANHDGLASHKDNEETTAAAAQAAVDREARVLLPPARVVISAVLRLLRALLLPHLGTDSTRQPDLESTQRLVHAALALAAAWGYGAWLPADADRANFERRLDRLLVSITPSLAVRTTVPVPVTVPVKGVGADGVRSFWAMESSGSSTTTATATSDFSMRPSLFHCRICPATGGLVPYTQAASAVDWGAMARDVAAHHNGTGGVEHYLPPPAAWACGAMLEALAHAGEAPVLVGAHGAGKTALVRNVCRRLLGGRGRPYLVDDLPWFNAETNLGSAATRSGDDGACGTPRLHAAVAAACTANLGPLEAWAAQDADAETLQPLVLDGCALADSAAGPEAARLALDGASHEIAAWREIAVRRRLVSWRAHPGPVRVMQQPLPHNVVLITVASDGVLSLGAREAQSQSQSQCKTQTQSQAEQRGQGPSAAFATGIAEASQAVRLVRYAFSDACVLRLPAPTAAEQGEAFRPLLRTWAASLCQSLAVPTAAVDDTAEQMVTAALGATLALAAEMERRSDWREWFEGSTSSRRVPVAMAAGHCVPRLLSALGVWRPTGRGEVAGATLGGGSAAGAAPSTAAAAAAEAVALETAGAMWACTAVRVWNTSASGSGEGKGGVVSHLQRQCFGTSTTSSSFSVSSSARLAMVPERDVLPRSATLTGPPRWLTAAAQETRAQQLAAQYTQRVADPRLRPAVLLVPTSLLGPIATLGSVFHQPGQHAVVVGAAGAGKAMLTALAATAVNGCITLVTLDPQHVTPEADFVAQLTAAVAKGQSHPNTGKPASSSVPNIVAVRASQRHPLSTALLAHVDLVMRTGRVGCLATHSPRPNPAHAGGAGSASGREGGGGSSVGVGGAVAAAAAARQRTMALRRAFGNAHGDEHSTSTVRLVLDAAVPVTMPTNLHVVLLIDTNETDTGSGSGSGSGTGIGCCPGLSARAATLLSTHALAAGVTRVLLPATWRQEDAADAVTRALRNSPQVSLLAQLALRAEAVDATVTRNDTDVEPDMAQANGLGTPVEQEAGRVPRLGSAVTSAPTVTVVAAPSAREAAAPLRLGRLLAAMRNDVPHHTQPLAALQETTYLFCTLLQRRSATIQDELQAARGHLHLLTQKEVIIRGFEQQAADMARALEAGRADESALLAALAEVDTETATTQEKDAANGAAMAATSTPLQELQSVTAAQRASVQPLLTEVADQLRVLRKEDVDELRTYVHPPPSVQEALKPLCILMRGRYAYKDGALPKGLEEPTWAEAVALLHQPNLYDDLRSYDMGAVSDRVLARAKAYTDNASYNPELLATASRAAAFLSRWVRATVAYATVAQACRPTLRRLARAEKTLAKQRATGMALAERLGKLQQRRSVLHAELTVRQAQLGEQEAASAVLDQKLARVRQLGIVTSDLLKRYRRTIITCEHGLRCILGDAALAAGAIAHLARASPAEAERQLESWLRLASVLGVVASPHPRVSALLPFPPPSASVEAREAALTWQESMLLAASLVHYAAPGSVVVVDPFAVFARTLALGTDERLLRRDALLWDGNALPLSMITARSATVTTTASAKATPSYAADCTALALTQAAGASTSETAGKTVGKTAASLPPGVRFGVVEAAGGYSHVASGLAAAAAAQRGSLSLSLPQPVDIAAHVTRPQHTGPGEASAIATLFHEQARGPVPGVRWLRLDDAAVGEERLLDAILATVEPAAYQDWVAARQASHESRAKQRSYESDMLWRMQEVSAAQFETDGFLDAVQGVRHKASAQRRRHMGKLWGKATLGDKRARYRSLAALGVHIYTWLGTLADADDVFAVSWPDYVASTCQTLAAFGPLSTPDKDTDSGAGGTSAADAPGLFPGDAYALQAMKEALLLQPLQRIWQHGTAGQARTAALVFVLQLLRLKGEMDSGGSRVFCAALQRQRTEQLAAGGGSNDDTRATTATVVGTPPTANANAYSAYMSSTPPAQPPATAAAAHASWASGSSFAADPAAGTAVFMVTGDLDEGETAPAWLQQLGGSWPAVQELGYHAAFPGLVSSLLHEADDWIAFLQPDTALLAPAPCEHTFMLPTDTGSGDSPVIERHTLSLWERLLLWQVLAPQLAHRRAWELVVSYLGPVDLGHRPSLGKFLRQAYQLRSATDDPETAAKTTGSATATRAVGSAGHTAGNGPDRSLSAASDQRSPASPSMANATSTTASGTGVATGGGTSGGTAGVTVGDDLSGVETAQTAPLARHTRRDVVLVQVPATCSAALPQVLARTIDETSHARRWDLLALTTQRVDELACFAAERSSGAVEGEMELLVLLCHDAAAVSAFLARYLARFDHCVAQVAAASEAAGVKRLDSIRKSTRTDDTAAANATGTGGGTHSGTGRRTATTTPITVTSSATTSRAGGTAAAAAAANTTTTNTTMPTATSPVMGTVRRRAQVVLVLMEARPCEWRERRAHVPLLACLERRVQRLVLQEADLDVSQTVATSEADGEAWPSVLAAAAALAQL